MVIYYHQVPSRGISSLENVDIVIINGDRNKKFEEIIMNINKDLKIFIHLMNQLILTLLKIKN